MTEPSKDDIRHSVRWPPDMLDRIRASAQRNGRSVNRQIVWLVQEALRQDEHVAQDREPEQ